MSSKLRPAKYEPVAGEEKQLVTNKILFCQKGEEGKDIMLTSNVLLGDKDSQSISDKESLLPPQQHEIQSNSQANLSTNVRKVSNVVSETEVGWPRLLNDVWAIERNALQPLSGNMNDLQERVETSCEINIRSITWNQQAQEFPSVETLREHLFSPEYFHILAVGTQECENSISKSMLHPSKSNWERVCGEALGRDFELIRGHSLQASHL